MARRWRWAGSSNAMVTVAGATQGVALLAETVVEKGETLTRIVGDVSVNLVAVSATNRRGAYGIIWLPTGITGGIPNPQADFDADWVYLYNLTLMPHVEVADFQTRHFLIDNRSMRKVKGNEQLMIVGNFLVSASNLSWGLRFGIKMV